MVFIFLLAEHTICKNLLDNRKYIADEEISEDYQYKIYAKGIQNHNRSLLYVLVILKGAYYG